MPIRRSKSLIAVMILSTVAGFDVPRACAGPWAVEVIRYLAGSNPEPDYVADPRVVLGPPERITGETTPAGPFIGGVTMFSAPWGTDEIISIGAGGELVVRFDDPITNDPSRLYGVDLIVFGNSFFSADFQNFTITGLNAEPATIEVSADGLSWHAVAGAADALFPTQGFLDAGVFGDPIGTQPTDFLRPVNPALTLSDFLGKSYEEALALYDGSGGGTPVDIASSGLAEAYYVRIRVPEGSAWSAEIDAFAVIPEPGAFGFAALLGMLALRRRRRR